MTEGVLRLGVLIKPKALGALGSARRVLTLWSLEAAA